MSHDTNVYLNFARAMLIPIVIMGMTVSQTRGRYQSAALTIQVTFFVIQICALVIGLMQ